MLPDVERFRLLHGSYCPPKFKVGGWLKCRLRGRVKVFSISDSPFQWPMTCQANGGKRMPVMVGDLVKAIRQESAQAVAHWWGVTAQTVSHWRKALGVEQNNAGTTRLRSKWWTDGGTGEASRPGREATFHSPERAAKIAASRRGKPRPPKIARALRAARKGMKHTEEARQKMREARERRGYHAPNGRPFTPEEDAILGTAPDKEVAAKVGRHVITIAVRRKRLGIPSFRKQTRGW